MAKLTLAPEDDDSDFPLTYNLGPSPASKVNETKAATDTQKLRYRFDPGKPEGRAIAPWPAVDRNLQIDEEDDTVILAEGREQEGQR